MPRKKKDVSELKADLEVLKAGKGGSLDEGEPKKKVVKKKVAKEGEKKTRKPNAWLVHLAEFRKNNKDLAPKDVMREAKKTYKK